MLLAVIRGGGDLASGIAVRLNRAGIKVVIAEIEQPLAVRRYVSFAEAVYAKSTHVEEIKGVLFNTIDTVSNKVLDECIPVIVDAQLTEAIKLKPHIVIDARMLKTESKPEQFGVQLVIGIGPGFIAGKNCQCVVETKRGPFLGRVYWDGAAEPDSGVPDRIGNFEKDRVLRAPGEGKLKAFYKIGDLLESGDVVAAIDGLEIKAPFKGVLRGIIHEGIQITKGTKIGDIDPRCDPLLCSLISDKALAVGGGVLEAIFTNENLRKQLID